ncbi:MAG: aminotransferase class I/II-fold pyridoxal phosphate-dependent enzyme [Candidatus Latescibacteria bacterium]|nr:aminotransferase class I/II-fold pyridoxal phosphate-dependent enzyme [Candidatus Latescibacterota bacterium]NIM64742.1 aminotransferase class I/II-fold pyridoxal phosphate-dependent enzyme [Candidatus Latescibacterota bacterium]NIO01252.1 aminotransferase class I/II-fold pyridoxal phosphate-dependent enzyme [Candidatus Latescibacterota bacterium]NIO27637.1 aminotransferase class I/II-fold pyridoxal phosphate-dependent enzyme [Candidatus Latescibacterota bacterium]NIO55169.1 aminotransferase
MNIPFVDLKAQYATIKKEIDSAIFEVVESAGFIGGKKVTAFEENFASYVGAKYGVGTSSGTSALHLALKALGIGPGDEVITCCNTFIATTEAITHTGATPVIVDVEEKTLTIDPNLIEAAITPRTKAVIPVHLFGQPADMDAVRDIALRHSLKVVTDAAQAHGAMIHGDRRAILGDITCYSFYPGKNLGAYGDAGMLVTDEKDVADVVAILGNHGRYGKHTHKVEGYNYRLDAIQAAVLDVKLRYLDEWIERRRSRAKRYTEAFANGPVQPVGEVEERYHVYHLYVIRTAKRDELAAALGERGIATGIHYPIPIHLLDAYRHLGLPKGTFPVGERAAEEMLSLPIYAELTDEMVDTVVSAVGEILS